MSVVLGSPTPTRFGIPETPAGAFPDTPGTYTSPDGAIVVPGGALDRWFEYRQTLGAVRGDVIAFGDSTTWGSGGGYSWMQRLRDRAVSYGFADGGKGIVAGSESEISYDAPEVNAFVSSTFAGSTDTFDNLTGNYWFDDSHVGAALNGQFRSTALRLWYSARFDAGEFTYSIDGGAPVTVNALGAGTTVKFVYVSGLTANTTHTIQVVNSSGAKLHIAIAPVNETGFATQKHAVSGSTFKNFFYGAITPADPYTQAHVGMRYQTALGLTATSVAGPDYTGAPVDETYDEDERVNPVLAMSHLGFNDLTSGPYEVGAWEEYVKRFAGACYDADCDGIVISGQLPYNDSWVASGEDRFLALKDTALEEELAFVDLFYPVDGPSLDYSDGPTNPHLTKPQYQAQADYLWDNLLGVTS